MKNISFSVLLALTCVIALVTSNAAAAPLYSNGFEVNTTDWNGAAVRVPSGTNGIPSSGGSFHAQVSGNSGAFTRWGGYNYGPGSVPTVFQPYSTSLDIYLNVGGGWGNDTRFDFSSAISNAAGGYLQDFIFNGGFYNDSDGSPGSGTDRFIISSSNNSQPGSAYAKNPARNPIAISATGWYTFEHVFSDNAGLLNVDMNIFDSSNALVGTWNFVGAPIGSVGGNRYGWFDFNQFSVLAFDNAQLNLAQAAAVPEPASMLAWGLIVGVGAVGYRLRKRQSLAGRS